MRILLVVLVVLCALGATAAPAGAAGLLPPVLDCEEHAVLTRHYTIAQLRAALNSIPADVAEYGDCHDAIQRQLVAQLGQLRVGNVSGASGGSFLPVWLIVLLALLVAGGAGFGLFAVRKSRTAEG